MKRDKVLLRALLEYIEEHASGGRRTRLNYAEFRAPHDQVDYHLRLLLDADFIRGELITNVPLVDELTWAGHEYLDSLCRDPVGDIPAALRD